MEKAETKNPKLVLPKISKCRESRRGKKGGRKESSHVVERSHACGLLGKYCPTASIADTARSCGGKSCDMYETRPPGTPFEVKSFERLPQKRRTPKKDRRQKGKNLRTQIKLRKEGRSKRRGGCKHKGSKQQEEAERKNLGSKGSKCDCMALMASSRKHRRGRKTHCNILDKQSHCFSSETQMRDDVLGCECVGFRSVVVVYRQYSAKAAICLFLLRN